MASRGDFMYLSLNHCSMTQNQLLASFFPLLFCSMSSCMRHLLPLLAQTVCNWPKQTYAVFAGEQDRVPEADYIAYTMNSDL